MFLRGRYPPVDVRVQDAQMKQTVWKPGQPNFRLSPWGKSDVAEG